MSNLHAFIKEAWFNLHHQSPISDHLLLLIHITEERIVSFNLVLCHNRKNPQRLALSATHTHLFFSGAVFSLRFLTVLNIIVSLFFQTPPPHSFSLVLRVFCKATFPFWCGCRGEWNNTIKRWWKRPEYFPPNLVFTAHSPQKASCLFLFGWQIIQSERGQAGCDTAGNGAEKYGDRLAVPCPLCFMWPAGCFLARSVSRLVFSRGM